MIGFLWMISLALVFLRPLALPPEKESSFFASAEITGEPQIDWLDLYIPSNPFRSLANNVVPAVVVFSILVGIALLGLPGKERILGPLALINDTLGRAGSLLVRLTPISLFAIAGHSAGTLRIEGFERLQAFLLVYVGLSLILTLWILPGLISALTGLSYRRILSRVQDPLLTAFVTANLFIVLPLLEQRAKQLLVDPDLKQVDADEAIDVLVPTSLTFPHSSKLLSLVFILFAGWFAGAPVSVRRFPAVAGAGLLSLFGSLNTAMPCLLDLAHMLAEDLNLRLVLVPVERVARKDALECGACDVAAGRIMPSQSGNVMFSRPIALEAWAFLVEDHRREVFASLDRVRQLPRPRIAIFQAPEWIARMKAIVPNAEVMPVSSIPEFIKAPQGSFDAMYTGFERATAFSLLYPKFSAVIPQPSLGSVPIALIVPRGEEELLDALNAWIEEEQANGLVKRKLDSWVHGKGTREELEPRWSVARDVRGWWMN